MDCIGFGCFISWTSIYHTRWNSAEYSWEQFQQRNHDNKLQGAREPYSGKPMPKMSFSLVAPQRIGIASQPTFGRKIVAQFGRQKRHAQRQMLKKVKNSSCQLGHVGRILLNLSGLSRLKNLSSRMKQVVLYTLAMEAGQGPKSKTMQNQRHC